VLGFLEAELPWRARCISEKCVSWSLASWPLRPSRSSRQLRLLTYHSRALSEGKRTLVQMVTDVASCRKFATEHLRYAVEQMHGLVERFLVILDHDREHGKRDLDFLDMPTRNAQVESFAVHARALTDFLYDVKRMKPTDALAIDYVPNGWTPPARPAILDTVKPRVGSEIAHLSYKRVGMTDDERQWEYVSVWNALAAVLRAFVAQASPTLLPEDVASAIIGATTNQPPTVRLLTLGAEAITGTNALAGPGTATFRMDAG
jgi:hypothetical protein